ncbi:hypothetical protein DW1_2246 [Proteiniborus sp. DW1]|uniref:hypothetical protein n=1 Tax=Proteiniborus sp. DW1 TaxID=1889883 RepID=UPI00092E13D1|nr:hypothetical protein [Proteiniborus sp. DW1]SCG83810.1 hypothetical protein DW1_2246 [Proteiniborus sp. DW1]
MEVKDKIYYTRTYRRLKKSLIKSVLYLCLLVIPVVTIFIFNIGNITRLMSKLAVRILGKVYPGIPLYIREDSFSILGTIEFVELPTVYPEISFVVLNLIVVLSLVIFLSTGSRKGKPISVYLSIMFLVHIINCIYFIFAANFFPYTAFQYSILYMKQQIGIWLTFIILTGLITGLLGAKGVLYRVTAFFAVLLYSLIFGTIRYVLFLYIIEEFSIIYMALLFFALGPFFDFLYLVAIYGIYMNKMIKLYDTKTGRGEWLWS